MRSTIIVLLATLGLSNGGRAQDVSQLPLSGNMFSAQCTSSSPSYTACIFYVIGATDGLNLVNAALEHFGQPKMFCLPESRGMLSPVTGVQTVDMMMGYLQRNPSRRHRPTISVLIDTLKEAFLVAESK